LTKMFCEKFFPISKVQHLRRCWRLIVVSKFV
jgi:hypothetical protein